ncbi:MAG: hypothetical protein GC185_12050 [Alphaproteobacteria bacterium]|nr:hypothetical protein [Alphaproteobacteria bacterium]
MSRAYHARNPGFLFTSRQEVEDRLRAKINAPAGSAGKIGTELELFVTTPEGLPPTFDQIELVLEHIADHLPRSRRAREAGRVVALDVPGLGAVSLEPGGQVELSTRACETMAELADANLRLRAALDEAAAFFDLRVKGQGHLPSFLQAQDMPRSRFAAYVSFLRGQHGAEKTEELLRTMKSCCGLQVNLDPMGADFHEIYRALLLTEVAGSLAAPTPRQSRLHHTYALLAPEQLTPVFEALEARDNEGLVRHIVDRLLTLKVPFLPDASSGEGFKSTAEVFGHVPTVGQLLQAGALTAQILDNALSLQLTMPNLRGHGVVETRAPDSVETPEELMAVAKQYRSIAYDAPARRKLLQDFADIDPQKLKAAFLARFDADTAGLDIGGGKTVAELVKAAGMINAAEPPRQAAQMPTPAGRNRGGRRGNRGP